MNILKYIFNSKYRKRKKFEESLKEKFPKSKIFPQKIVPIDILEFGKYSYGYPIVETYYSKGEKLRIGNYVSIADNVTFILSGEHHLDTFSTFPFRTQFFNSKENETLNRGEIVVKDDVWLGYGVKILSGVTIGQGAVVGTGSVVTKNLEPYGIYGGIPAKLIRYRFSKEIRDELLKIEFSKIDFNKFKEYQELLYEKLDLEVIEKIKQIGELRK